MIWSIPAKTFLLGEYAVLADSAALILTTSPCFEVRVLDKPTLLGIHPESPAGKYWQDFTSTQGICFYDPYHSLGGMGASSAQFIGAYLSTLDSKEFNSSALLKAYFNYAWNGVGLRPSGYDVLAQISWGCSYLNKTNKAVYSYPWVFEDLSFILLHTGHKLPTHNHLQEVGLPDNLDRLKKLVVMGKEAFDSKNSQLLIEAVNAYAQTLSEFNLVAPHTLELVRDLMTQPEVLAAKGCGAMGADVVVILISKAAQQDFCKKLQLKGLRILATAEDLYSKTGFIENFMHKTLEISA
ncbi:hypothetical protein [Legionella yabuuchiae]|uniref:hypothetical protein n=1 Tax=Legionella yabuuchiae TaxID=376727 RepID=UPI00105477C5|nr:hypothetical protein [Legionella yabuuchiae]